MEGSKSLLYVAAACLPYHISGYTSRTHEILKALKAAGLQAEAITRPGYPWDRRDSLSLPPGEESERDGERYRHFRSPAKGAWLIHYALKASKIIEEHCARLKAGRLHAASNHVNALPALLAAKRLGIPFQYEMRGLWELTRASRFPAYDGSPAFRLGLGLEGFVASHADKVFVISKQLGHYAQRNWNIDESKLALLPNCVDMERIKPLPDVELDPSLIGYAGSLMPYEGLDMLLEALALLKARGTRARLLLIGDGEARPALEALAESLGLRGEVSFAGRMEPEAARRLLARAALVCLPRKPHEVCKIVTPIKLVEAMAMGKPVICPDLPVFMDELGDLARGRVFAAGSLDSLAAKIKGLLGKRELLEREGRLSREHALKSRQWKQFVPSIMEPLPGAQGAPAASE